jgi:OFA family oxalate/formate antiporter-like MFS transporter
VAVGASVLVGLGFVLAAFAKTPPTFYVFYGLGGLGVGILYGISTACAIKWFPDRRGFAVGLIVFGFGAGTLIFNWIIQGLLELQGLGGTFMVLGCAMIVILVPLSLLYRYPVEDPDVASVSLLQAEKTKLTFRPVEMMMTRQWLLIYFSFAVTVSIVLMFGAQMKILAKEFGIPNRYFGLVLVLFPLGNGLSRVLAGAVSDRIGREKTMTIFYSLLGLSIIVFVLLGHNPILFIVIVFIAALLGGAPFALYPATIGDYYGTRYSTTNYGITYTAKAWAGLISGWLTGYLVMQFGSYRMPMVLVALGSLIAAVISSPRFISPPEKKTP